MVTIAGRRPRPRRLSPVRPARGRALLVVAGGGALAMALAAAVGSVTGAAIGKAHADRPGDSLREGGTLPWVFVADAAEERKVAEIPKQGLLKKAGGADTCMPARAPAQGQAESPFGNWIPDPFLNGRVWRGGLTPYARRRGRSAIACRFARSGPPL